MSLLRFIGILCAAAAVAHLVVSIAAVSTLRALYSHRIFNVRAWPSPSEAYHLAGSFIKENGATHDRPTVAFAGSSVSYGYPWDERFVFSKLFAERHPDLRVINSSIVAADISGVNQWIVCAALRSRVRFDALVIEIPVVNTTTHLVALRKNGRPVDAAETCAPGPGEPGYLQLALARPRGVAWLPFLLNNESAETVETAFRLGKVPKGYFTSQQDFALIKSGYERRIADTLRNAREIAETVYAFPSPVLLAVLPEIGEDEGTVRWQIESALGACRSVESVRCIDPQSFYDDRSLYQNLTHLNQAGHRAMADLLFSSLTMSRASH